MSLTPEHIAIVKSTVPILKAGGEALTTYFYQLMLREDGIVKPFFNPGHQAEGSQPRALAYSLLCVASNIDTISELLASPAGALLINQIVTKHVSMCILPEHYPIVGKNLLRAIREVLGEEVATDAVLEAWGIVYGIVADLLINAEAAQYDTLAATPGGWRGQRDFVITSKTQDTPTSITYTIQSKDKQPVLQHAAGQYLTLRIQDPQNNMDTVRNYSICDVVLSDENGVDNIYQFTTALVPGSVMPFYLQQFKNVGDVLQVNTPTGEFVLNEKKAKEDGELFFCAAGSGITPFIAMAKAARQANAERKITLLHIVQNAEKQLLKQKVEELKEKYNVNVHVYFTQDVGNKLYDAEQSNKPSAAS